MCFKYDMNIYEQLFFMICTGLLNVKSKNEDVMEINWTSRNLGISDDPRRVARAVSHGASACWNCIKLLGYDQGAVHLLASGTIPLEDFTMRM